MMNLYEVKSKMLRQLIYADTAKAAKREFFEVSELYGLVGDPFGIWKLFTRVKLVRKEPTNG